MARDLGLAVLAEGIETADQLDAAIATGCETGQGWLFSQALPGEEITRLVLHQIQDPSILAT